MKIVCIKKLVSMVFLVLVLLAGGCAELRNGDQSSDSPTGPTFFFGELRYTEITPMARAWRGMQAALKEMGYTLKSGERDLLQARAIAFGDGKEIKIYMEENSPTTTEIRIRAGKIGDKALAEKILAAIRKHL
jgi:hypothetical protein